MARGDLFRARTTREIVKITARQLDYWIEKRLVIPAKVYRALSELPMARRKIDYLFDFTNLVQLRLIRTLRTAGVPLQQVRVAVEKLGEAEWHKKWLVHDGQDVHLVRGNRLETLTGRRAGQLGFSVVLLPELRTAVEQGVEAHRHERFDASEFEGKGEVVDFEKVRELRLADRDSYLAVRTDITKRRGRG